MHFMPAVPWKWLAAGDGASRFVVLCWNSFKSDAQRLDLTAGGPDPGGEMVLNLLRNFITFSDRFLIERWAGGAEGTGVAAGLWGKAVKRVQYFVQFCLPTIITLSSG